MSKIVYKDFKKVLNSYKKNEKCYLFFGDNSFLIKLCEQKLKEKILNNNENSFNFVDFDGENLDLTKLFVALETVPVGASLKYVRVKNLAADKLETSDFDDFCENVSQIPDFSVLVLCQNLVKVNYKKSKKWNKLVDLFSDNGLSVELGNSNKIDLVKQLNLWIKENKKKISTENIDFIMDFCGKDLNVLKNEVDKLCFFVDSEEITQSSIEDVAVPSVEANVFSIFKDIMEKNYKKVYDQIDLLFGQKEDPIGILSVISSNFVDMFRTKSVKNSRNLVRISEIFNYRNKEFKLKIAEKYCRNISFEKLRKCVKILIDADFKLKFTQISARAIIDETIAIIIENLNVKENLEQQTEIKVGGF